MTYILDGVRESREDGCVYLCIDVFEPLEQHEKMWEAWNTGEMPHGFDSYNNEFGRTCAWYVPLYLAGEKLGVIGAEVEITDYNRTIAANTLRQLFYHYTCFTKRKKGDIIKAKRKLRLR